LASNAKKKTTFAKLNREAAVRERRLRKQARKQERREAASAPPPPVREEDGAPELGQPDVNPPDRRNFRQPHVT
jgi:hypothetical protein